MNAAITATEQPGRVAVRRRASAVPLTVGAALAVNAVVLVPWVFGPGTHMDEGAILVYARLVFHGVVPMRDVRGFYGPLNSYVVGTVLNLVGWSMYAERAIGVVYRLLLAGSLYGLVRHRGRAVVAAACVLIVLMPPATSVIASASSAALAFACLAVWLASRRRPFAAGSAAGVALLMRYDWLPALLLASTPWLLVWPWRLRRRALAGFAATAAVYVPYLALVGLANVRYSVKLLHTGQQARRLAIPSAPQAAGILLDLGIAAMILLFVVGIRRRRTTEGRVFLSVALMSVALVPYATWAADRNHVLDATFAPIVVAAAAVSAGLDELRPFLRAGATRLVGLSLAVAASLLLILSLSVSSDNQASLTPRAAHVVSYHGRSFLLPGRQEAADARLAVARADELAPKGGRLYVGPSDLGGLLSDTYFYYLLPRLRPATFFIALDPGVTEFRPHRLVDELTRADVIILNSNDDSYPTGGDLAAQHVLASRFCKRGGYGAFTVYARCRGTQVSAGDSA